jgi:hypothetical protein
MKTFTSFEEWRTAMIERARLTLDRDYCQERIDILGDETLPETKLFIKVYGITYHKQVFSWFQKALSQL